MSETSSIAEGDRLHDSGWKKIQENTFTRWVNQNLALEGLYVESLQTDLSDGIKLIKLVQVLAQRVVASRYNKRPSLRQQKLDNVQQALNFIQNDEGIKLVTIDGTHIVDGNLKLILGLIWTLIYHYSIGQHIDDKDQKKGQTPKQRLLAWIRHRVPSDLPLTNFTSDWNDGTALGALVESLAPGACADWRAWKPHDALPNTRRAMRAAQDSLGVGQLIAPEELINPNVDEKSVMTYLSQFPRAQAPPKGRISGVDAEPVVGRETHFTVEVEREGVEPSVDIADADGNHPPVSVRTVDGSATLFSVTYEPQRVGKHEVRNRFAPLQITVHGLMEQTKTRLGQLTVRAIPAPYLVDFRDRVEVGELQKFRLANLTERNQAEVFVLDPRGQQRQVDLQQRVGASVAFVHRPDLVGLHSVNVFVDKRHIPGSPFPLHALPTAAASALVWGRGLCRKGARVGDRLRVHVDGCGKPVEVTVRNKDGLPVHAQPCAPAAGRQSVEYAPLGAGVHTVAVTCNGQHLGLSPYQVEVGPKTELVVRAVGPGLEMGVANQPAVFYVDTKGDANVLEFSTEGPSQADIESVDNGDNTAVVSYTPTKSGVYKVNIMKNGEHIKDSPFVVMIDPETEPRPIEAPRLSEVSSENVKVGKLVEFAVEADKTPQVKVYDPDFAPVDNVHQVGSAAAAEHRFEFAARKPGRYVVCPTVDKVAVGGSPLALECAPALDLTKLHVYGPGVGAQVRTDHTASFSVDARDLDYRSVEVDISAPDGSQLPADILHADPSKPIQVSYHPKVAGLYKAKVYVDGQLAFDVPVEVTEPRRKLSTSSTSTSSMGAADRAIPTLRGANTAAADAALHLMLRDVQPQQLRARIQCPDGRVETVPLQHRGNDHFTINFQPRVEGVHVIDVLHQGQRVQGAPFRLSAGPHEPVQAHLVRAEGPGLEAGRVGQRQVFSVLVGEAGGGELKASINGPSKADITLTDYRDGVCQAEYTTDEPGLYSISLSVDEQPVHGSPFKVYIEPGSKAENSPPAKRAFSAEQSSVIGSSFEKLENEIGENERTNENLLVYKQEFEENAGNGSQLSGFGNHVKFIEETQLNSSNENDGMYRQEFEDAIRSVAPLQEVNRIEQQQQQQGRLSSSFTCSTVTQKHEFALRYEPAAAGHLRDVLDGAAEGVERVLRDSAHFDQRHRQQSQRFSAVSADDVRRVAVEGAGLYEFAPGRAASFTVNTSKAGRSYLFVGIVTSKGPSDEVNVKHVGGGEYVVSYKIPERTRALVIVKYGDMDVIGSPFTVRPASLPGIGQ